MEEEVSAVDPFNVRVLEEGGHGRGQGTVREREVSTGDQQGGRI